MTNYQSISSKFEVRPDEGHMIILGIETSCDETAISVVEANGDLKNLEFKLLGSSINSQIDIHKEYGGVFPTLAKREHIKNLPVVYEEALKKAGIKESEIEMIMVTVGPGLEPALWTGIKFAEELGKRLDKSVIPTNHMNGHLASVLLSNKKTEFPAIGLLVSGGHTELILIKNWFEKEKLGETQDDAVGEAFDKVARMLGLSYPGGPEISKLAQEAREKNIKLEKEFPRPMMHSKDYNFSFSGLKTAVLYYLKNLQKSSRGNDFADSIKFAVAREFEDAAIETLVSKTNKAIEAYFPKTLIVGGGVIANKFLRENIIKLKDKHRDLEIMLPEKDLTTDNATMIAIAGYLEYLKSGDQTESKLEARGNLNIS